MSIAFKSKLIPSAIFAACCTSASAWQISNNFDACSLGQMPQTTLVEYFSKTICTSEPSNISGDNSASIGVVGGTNGWGDFGALFYFPKALSEGGELWYQVKTYMPSTFDYTSPTFALKFMRVKTPGGYIDLYIKPDGTYLFQNEIVNQNEPFSLQDNTALRNSLKVQKDTWETYEVYVKLNSVAGIVRIWKDGKLAYENKKWKTLPSSTATSDTALLFTYWNGNAPQTQKMYIDDLTITSDTPAAKDSYGNSYLGATAKQAAPMAPTLSVSPN